MDPVAGTPEMALRYLCLHLCFAGFATAIITVQDVLDLLCPTGAAPWELEGYKILYGVLLRVSPSALSLWISIFQLYLYSEMMEYLL
ncbi:hypothetical protein J3F84DRAFT_367641 [Trichoderma pleuroticola]